MAGNQPDSSNVSVVLLEQMRAEVRRGRFDEAFALGESLLDASPSSMILENLSNQLTYGTRQQRMDRSAIKALERYAARKRGSPWPLTLLVDAYAKVDREDEALSLADGLAAFPKRYWWMRYAPGYMRLIYRRDYAGAAREFRAVAKTWPAFWQARAHLAELELCRGREVCGEATVTSKFSGCAPGAKFVLLLTFRYG